MVQIVSALIPNSVDINSFWFLSRFDISESFFLFLGMTLQICHLSMQFKYMYIEHDSHNSFHK